MFFGESIKRWFLHVFQFVINFTPLDILLGIPNYDNSNVIMNLNFVILFAKYFIYDCKKNDKPVDFYNFQVKLKTRMVIEEYTVNQQILVCYYIWRIACLRQYLSPPIYTSIVHCIDGRRGDAKFNSRQITAK